MKNLSAFDLVKGNVSRKPVRTAVLAVLVAVFTMTLFCSTIIAEGLYNGTMTLAERLGADALFVPHGYEKKIQGSLLRGEPSTFYLDSSLEEKLRTLDGVEKVSSQLFVASLSAACCTLPVQIIGFDPATDFVVKPWFDTVLHRNLSEDEIIVGHKIIANVGDKIQFFGKEYAVAARLAPTGMGFDTSVFMNVQEARRLLGDSEIAELPPTIPRNKLISSTLVKMEPSFPVRDTVNKALQMFAIEYNLDFVMVSGMISDIAGRLGVISIVLYGLSGGIWVLAVGVLALVFSAILQERRKEFGMLRVIGATRGMLVRFMLLESLCISVLGGLLGLVVAVCVLFPFSAYIQESLKLPSVWPDLYRCMAFGGLSFLLGAVVGPLSCLYTAFRLGRQDAYAAIREDG